MKPLVSIITPIYNAMPYLNTFLDSVENQTYAPLELILVDDGSTDDSLSVLTERAVIMEEKGISVKVLSQNHAGQVAAVNLALPSVHGELLTWCDADDYWTDDSIEKKVECLLTHPDINMVRSNGLIKDETENPIMYREKIISRFCPIYLMICSMNVSWNLRADLWCEQKPCFPVIRIVRFRHPLWIRIRSCYFQSRAEASVLI